MTNAEKSKSIYQNNAAESFCADKKTAIALATIIVLGNAGCQPLIEQSFSSYTKCSRYTEEILLPNGEWRIVANAPGTKGNCVTSFTSPEFSGFPSGEIIKRPPAGYPKYDESYPGYNFRREIPWVDPYEK